MSDRTKTVQDALTAVYRLADENDALRRSLSVIRSGDREKKLRILELEGLLKRLQAELRRRG